MSVWIRLNSSKRIQGEKNLSKDFYFNKQTKNYPTFLTKFLLHLIPHDLINGMLQCKSFTTYFIFLSLFIICFHFYYYLFIYFCLQYWQEYLMPKGSWITQKRNEWTLTLVLWNIAFGSKFLLWPGFFRLVLIQHMSSHRRKPHRFKHWNHNVTTAVLYSRCLSESTFVNLMLLRHILKIWKDFKKKKKTKNCRFETSYYMTVQRTLNFLNKWNHTSITWQNSFSGNSQMSACILLKYLMISWSWCTLPYSLFWINICVGYTCFLCTLYAGHSHRICSPNNSYRAGIFNLEGTWQARTKTQESMFKKTYKNLPEMNRDALHLQQWALKLGMWRKRTEGILLLLIIFFFFCFRIG